MTTPYERTRALVYAYHALKEVESCEAAPAELRRSATVALRHFPSPAETTAHAWLCVSALNWLGPPSEDPNGPAAL